VAERGALGPKTEGRRALLDRVVGPQRVRLQLYFLRRYCGIGLTEWRSLPWEERELLLEGLRAQYGQQPWNEAVESMVEQIKGPEYAPAAAPQEVRDDSLASLAEMGITVREVS
jgi:hypothetical protein